MILNNALYLFIFLSPFIFYQKLNSFEPKEITRNMLKTAQKKIIKENFSRNGHRSILQIYQGGSVSRHRLHVVNINTNKTNLDTCIITFSSLNQSYNDDKYFLTQIKELKKHNYVGHYLYRIGGWPNMESGCLSHCEIPYFFKFCALKEALDLGYKTIIWVDLRCHVLHNLDSLIKFTKKNGISYRYSLYPFNNQCPKALIEDFRLSNHELNNFRHIAATILGFNTQNPSIRRLINDLHQTHNKKKSFFSFFPEQLVLSTLLNRANLQNHSYPNIHTYDAVHEISIKKHPFLFGKPMKKKIREQKLNKIN